MATKISSYDFEYIPGDLSLFPEAIDNYESLYFATNNAETTLSQSLLYGSNIIIVNDTKNFPEKGLIRVNLQEKFAAEQEYIYYDEKTDTTFKNLIRGFGGSRQQSWPINSQITGGVFADHHNALKDAVIQSQTYLGVENTPAGGSLNFTLQQLENRFYSPQPIFRSYPRSGRLPLTVKFQNFSSIVGTKYFWDFGDGSTSLERSPEHIYITSGTFSVSLRIITTLGGQGFVRKADYIVASDSTTSLFFYTVPLTGYSIKTANRLGVQPTIFNLVDQSEGAITERFWIFDDGQTENIIDPYVHYTSHVFSQPGTYTPSLILSSNGTIISKVFSTSSIRVI